MVKAVRERHATQRLKVLCPAMGKKRIAQVLTRAGLFLSATTVRRIPGTVPAVPPNPPQDIAHCTGRVVTANYPNHVWHVDLTVVPTSAGFWTTWLPFAHNQVWPFAWWVAVVLDHFSRRIIGFAMFKSQPTSLQIQGFLDRAIVLAGREPKYIVCDRGTQF